MKNLGHAVRQAFQWNYRSHGWTDKLVIPDGVKSGYHSFWTDDGRQMVIAVWFPPTPESPDVILGTHPKDSEEEQKVNQEKNVNEANVPKEEADEQRNDSK